jgi:serpin B
VLTDALYLDAGWATPFTPSLTKPGPFATASGGSATPQYMHGGGYRLATADGWTAVSLPYRGGALAMTALLPPAGAGCRVPAAGTLGRVTSDLASQASPITEIALPRVNLSSRAEMNGLLAGLGMGVAFGTGADFTGLSPRAGSITVVEHAATLQVGEKGTVATAATAVGVAPALAITAPAREIVFDRPYLMLVTDTATGEPLFLARVANPAAS